MLKFPTLPTPELTSPTLNIPVLVLPALPSPQFLVPELNSPVLPVPALNNPLLPDPELNNPVLPVPELRPPKPNWLFPGTRELLSRSISKSTRLIVELGSWTGRSTRFLADLAPQATVIAIDHWEGSPEHKEDPNLAPLLPRLYETFLSECWAHRDQIIPVKMRSIEGMHRVAEAGLEPDLVYIDADHGFESVLNDLTSALDLFPRALIVGDDWNWDSVRQAVERVAKGRSVRYESVGSGWRIVRQTTAPS